nr:AlpA family phage regulatory protein [Paraburkholderia tropica]
MALQTNPALAILRRPQVEDETGLSRTTIYRRIGAKTFPAQVQLGPRCVGWRRGDIDAFLISPATYRAPEAA